MRLLAFAFLSLFLIGCSGSDKNIKYAGSVILPTDAENVKDAGNGWYTFDYGTKKFLMADILYNRYSFEVGPSDKTQKELDVIGDLIEENLKKYPRQVNPFGLHNDPAPIPPTKDEESRSI